MARPCSPTVAQLLTCDDWGGTEVQVLRQVIALSQHVKQAVVTLAPSGPIAAALGDAGIPVMSLGDDGRPSARSVAAALRSLRPDVVESYGFRAGLLVRPVSVTQRTAHIIGVRGHHFTEGAAQLDHRARVALGCERVLQRTVSVYAANSQRAAERLVEAGISPRRVAVIPNAIPLLKPAVPSAWSDRPMRVMCVARFIPRKRHDVLLAALVLLRDEGIPVRAQLVGWGPLENDARRAIQHLRLEGSVTILGRMSYEQTLEAMRQADVVTLCSTAEGLPNVVLEAMALGLPVVATDVDGTREVVTADTGVLVAASSAGDLARGLRTIACDPEAARRMGETGRRRVYERFGLPKLVERKLALYDRVLTTSVQRS